MLLGVAGFGVATIVFGISKIFWLSLLALALTGHVRQHQRGGWRANGDANDHAGCDARPRFLGDVPLQSAARMSLVNSSPVLPRGGGSERSAP